LLLKKKLIKKESSKKPKTPTRDEYRGLKRAMPWQAFRGSGGQGGWGGDEGKK
jgi:hypothetical protein